MFYIIETEKQLSRLEDMGHLGCFADIITTSDNFHPALSKVVALYIRPFDEYVDPETQEPRGYNHGYIIPIDHNEGLCVSEDRAFSVLNKFTKIYVLDKKNFMYHSCASSKNLIDIGILYSMVNFERLELTVKDKTYNWYYNRYGGVFNINQIIPLTKLFECRENIFNQIEEVFSYKLQQDKTFLYYNDLFPKLYYLVESQGIRIDVHNFVELFKPTNPDFSISGETVYSRYNLCNVTSRPTNSFNAVNFLAIPKGKKFGQCFRPRPGCKFVEMDFDGYHVRLVSREIGYKLNLTEKAHKQLAKLYFGKSEISDEEYALAKQTNFKAIYGAIPEEYEHLEFFKKLKNYIRTLWKEYRTTGEVQNLWGKKFTDKLKSMNPSKLMNYMIQSIETGRNIEVLYKVLRYLRDKKTRILLITYDSFLLEWNEEDGKEVLEDVQTLMEKGGFPVHVKVADDLNF